MKERKRKRLKKRKKRERYVHFLPSLSLPSSPPSLFDRWRITVKATISLTISLSVSLSRPRSSDRIYAGGRRFKRES
eukprot:1343077-Amorphochlora_amoeboformis.AAC.1